LGTNTENIFLVALWGNQNENTLQPCFRPQVKDDNNYDFLTKLLINIGVVVPNPATVQAALAAVGKEHCLLGKAAGTVSLQARVVCRQYTCLLCT